MRCTLCNSETILYSEIQNKKYCKCTTCDGILLHTSHFLSAVAEKERYELHQNDVTDSGYQNFVYPIIEQVQNDYSSNHKGLDFGSGSNSVITYLLNNNKYHISTYDPFFDINDDVLKKKYDYIVCCEVMEHFYSPSKEFKLLHSILLPNGALYCKTNLYDSSIDFKTWWYKNDTTHVFFYSSKTLHWIKEKFQFKSLEITDNFIVLRKE
ncbi:class I SAM-dependent methyltransferase [Aquimarina algiphila]|uniref:class I SAM-dependent methyltransferase n=1 Tax=Aquimarina algiphila TaxID=2047982 RepID=UPI00232E711B|nr:class I SAM-dependent methyltransferase [Aquimarina algiphila]